MISLQLKAAAGRAAVQLICSSCSVSLPFNSFIKVGHQKNTQKIPLSKIQDTELYKINIRKCIYTNDLRAQQGSIYKMEIILQSFLPFSIIVTNSYMKNRAADYQVTCRH